MNQGSRADHLAAGKLGTLGMSGDDPGLLGQVAYRLEPDRLGGSLLPRGPFFEDLALVEDQPGEVVASINSPSA